MGTATELFSQPLLGEGGLELNTHFRDNNSKAIAENSILNKWFYIYCANSIITDQEEGWILTFLHPQTISDISD